MQMIHRSRTSPHIVCGVLLASLVLGSGVALAADYPVTGAISVDGDAGVLPPGGLFVASSYDPVSGAIGAGAFSFPEASTDVEVPGFGMVRVTYLLSQTNSSGGWVAEDGVAVLEPATMKLQVVRMTLGGFPIGVGTCVFQPIEFELGGIATVEGLELDDEGFTIPPVANTDCAGFGAQINEAIAGSNNSVELLVAGNFTPPSGADDDTIFDDGFDGQLQ